MLRFHFQAVAASPRSGRLCFRAINRYLGAPPPRPAFFLQPTLFDNRNASESRAFQTKHERHAIAVTSFDATKTTAYKMTSNFGRCGTARVGTLFRRASSKFRFPFKSGTALVRAYSSTVSLVCAHKGAAYVLGHEPLSTHSFFSFFTFFFNFSEHLLRFRSFLFAL